MQGFGLVLAKVCIGICLGADGGGTTVVCPSLRTWTPEFQKQLAGELREAPKKDALGRVVADAITDRDIARACRKQGY